MTSRFGKTYSRKGGEGTSKFDEVLSNKRATLSTKWGETTYKAKVGSKRPGSAKNDSVVVEVPKKARVSDPSSEDPFGFDSDDESKPVTSRGVAQTTKASPTKPASAEPPRAERPGFSPDAGSRSSQQGRCPAPVPSRGASLLGSDRGRLRVVEDTARFFNSSSSGSSLTTTGPPSQPGATEPQHQSTYSWYRNASDSDKKPLAQTTALKTGSKSDATYDPWDAVMGLKSPSPPLEHRAAPRHPPSMLWASSSGGPGVAGYGHSQGRSSGLGLAPREDRPSPPPPAQTTLLRSSNCRTYRRPNNKKTADPNGSSSSSSSTSSTSSVVGGVAKAEGGGGRGRARDYTVLHPSCVSMCNVTIQDSLDRSGPEEFGAAGATGDQQGGAGDLSPVPSGASSYKIQYFGFDDMSGSEEEEEEEEDEEGGRERRKAKRAAAKAAAAAAAVAAVTEPVEDRPPLRPASDSRERLEDFMEFQDESVAVASELPSRPHGKTTAEKSKESRKIFSGPRKSPTKAVYNARHWNRPECEELPPPPLARTHTAPASASGPSKDSNPHKDDGLFKAPPPPPKVIKSVTIPTEPYQDIVTALKCRKEHKELYTVVQHVKHFNDVVEFGENQEFTDDFEYLATGLKSGQPLNTRCLSVISLATRCAMPSFRMHLRARGKVAQVFKTLNDAPQHPNLALCTASLMYILSRDRLNMDLDRASLDLMIRLLEMDQDSGGSGDASTQLSAREIAKVKEKIRKLCETVHNKHLDLQNITAGHLAMETLLSLTSKRAGDWFKEELRLLGGLDHIVDKVKDCVGNLSQEDDKEELVASLWGAERCLRVLESVTVHNPENQGYLIAYKDSSLIVSSAKALSHCEGMIQRYSVEMTSSVCSTGGALPFCSNSNVAKAVQNCMRAIIGVLLNLTHDNEWGSTKTGEQDNLIMTALNCVLRVPQYLPQEQRFDVRVLGLGLLINLVEYSARNRYGLVEMEMEAGPCDTLLLGPNEDLSTLAPTNPSGALSAIAALVQLFLQRERAAVLAEAQTDDLIKEPVKPADKSGEWQESGGEIQWVAAETPENDPKEEEEDPKDKKKKEEEDEVLDLNKALQHAGKHMEDSIVASYTALLLGCLCQGSPMNVTTVRESLPKGDFSILTEMLKKFLNFMNLTCDVGTAGQKSISRVIDYLEHC
ncbi:wings apart-like protein homolog [Aplochiton taeniatus]